jgi:hypothetical protein
MAEGRRIALLLQFEPHVVDAARGVHREHECEIDGIGLREGGQPKRKDKANRREGASKKPHAQPAIPGHADGVSPESMTPAGAWKHEMRSSALEK